MSNTVGNTLSSKDYYRVIKPLNKEVIFKDIPRGRVNKFLKRVAETLYKENEISSYMTPATILGKTYCTLNNHHMLDIWHQVYAPGSNMAVIEFLVAYRVAYGIKRFLGTV